MKSSITYGENYSDKILVASFAGISDYLNIGMFCSIFPYIVASIDSGMSDNSLANYTALIESIYYCMEIIGAFLGGYLGDAFGKKFVILYCITGYIIAASLLGMAETFIMLTISKVLFGLMGGIMPNLRGYVLNVTVDSNMHSLYKYIGLCSAGT